MMVKEISEIEFEKNMFDAALHGVDSKTIQSMKDDFYKSKNKNKSVQKKGLSIQDFRNMGLSVGKDNKTVVKR